MTITDLNAEIRALCDATTTSYTAADLLRRVNSALEELVGDIINADGTWQFDDTNYTDIPVGTGTLVDGQASYSFASEYLDIEEIDVKDSGGTYRKIKPLDPSEIPDNYTVEEYFGTTASFPEYYDKNGDTITLYPAPASASCTLSAGLRIRFKRTADLFTSAQVTTGTKVPGIPSPFHQLLAYMAAVPYCASYKKDRVALYEKKIDEGKSKLIKHLGRREKDRKKLIRNRGIIYR